MENYLCNNSIKFRNELVILRDSLTGAVAS